MIKKKQPFIKAFDLIKNQRTLSNMVVTTENLKLINKTIETSIRPVLAEHLRAMDIKNGIVFIRCSNACIATKMRFETNKLIAALKKHKQLEHIFNIQFKVDIENNEKRPNPTQKHATQRQASISKYSKCKIEKAAKSLKDESLAKALLRLIS